MNKSDIVKLLKKNRDILDKVVLIGGCALCVRGVKPETRDLDLMRLDTELVLDYLDRHIWDWYDDCPGVDSPDDYEEYEVAPGLICLVQTPESLLKLYMIKNRPKDQASIKMIKDTYGL